MAKKPISNRMRLLIGVFLPFLLVAMVLGTILALRWSSHFIRHGEPAKTGEASAPAAPPGPTPTPAVPSPQQVAAAPHPPVVEAPDNPPATETGPSVVVEEPVTPLPLNEPPPPAADPREPVNLAVLAPPSSSGATAPDSVGPAPVPVRSRVPDWQRLAVAAPPTGGKPMIAVIIDDMGLDRRRSGEILDLPGPLTISFMSYAEDMPRQLAEARAKGDEIMMHVPMEPLDAKIDPGPGVLTDALSPREVRDHLDADLAKFGGIVGINNHMGSKFTAFAPGMEVVMQDLRERGLLFIDSLTTEKSVGLAMARRYGVPSAGRNVFLDNAGDLIAVDFELGKLEEVARAKGNAIAIGHPRDATIAALAKWLPTLKDKGFVLVPVTAIVRTRMQSETQAATR
jgi:polysaccharide deacetylase 2 family uncharacterized protein YibQ